MEKNVDLSEGSIPKLLFSLALPSIIAQVINVLYNMVDRMFIGHIDKVGTLALTGVGVSMPIIMAISAFASLVCMGGAPRAAIALGKKDKDGAEKIMSNCFSLLVVMAAVLTVVFLIFAEQMLFVFGASNNTIGYAVEYLDIYIIGTVFVQISIGMNAFINTQGYAKMGMITVMIGAVLNIILDPIFIFALGMGVKGAALATVISQAVSAFYVMWFINSDRSYLHIHRNYLKLDRKVILPCIALGLSPFVMQITESVISVIFNTSLLKYGGDIAVGAMVILTSVMQFSLLPLVGMTQGSQPIISFNYGAKKKDRIRDTFKLLLIVCLVYSAVLWAISVFAPGVLASIFTNDPDLYSYTCWALRIYMGMSLIFGAQIACQQTFIALGNAKSSLFLAILRKIILLIPLIYIMPMFFENKVFGVYFAEPVADTIAVISTCIAFYRFYRKKLVD